MGRRSGVLFVWVVRHAVPIMTRRGPCCRIARVVGIGFATHAGLGSRRVVQTEYVLLLLRDVKRVDSGASRAGLKLPTLLVFCTLRSGWPLPAPLTLRARKGLLYVRARVCACSLA